MRKILTISLNPALDSAADVAVVTPDVKLRCVNPTLEPGGGGVNVSRAIKLLGGESAAFVALGGATGNMMSELLAEENVHFTRFDGPVMTRQSFAISETETGKQYRFGQPGPVWPAQDAARALGEIRKLLEKDMLVVASGSLPPGVADDFYVKLGLMIADAGALMVVDTSGDAQQAIMADGKGLVHVLRMDRHESEILAGRPLTTLKSAADFAQDVAKKEHAKLVILARGAEGSVFATEDMRFHWVAPKVQVISKVGAGDSFVAGLTYGLAQDMSLQDAGRLATAAAAAAVQSPGSQLCKKPMVDALLENTEYAEI